MSKSRLVFVLGAGASNEVNLPVGAELRAEIARLLDIRYENFDTRISGDDRIPDAFRIRAYEGGVNYDINPYLQTSWRIRDAMPQAASIDNFLDVHGTDERIIYCGKLAIARAILAAERRSSLYFEERSGAHRPNFSAIEATWYNRFWQKLTENCRLDDLQPRLKTVAFIDFNYDRCIEHFLYCALQNYYGVDGQGAAEILSVLKIFHPYGRVGNLPWANADARVSFGADIHPKTLNALTTQIRTFAEGTDPNSSDIIEIRSLIKNASSVIFLGFAYHRINLKLIFPDYQGHKHKKQINIYGTAKEISFSDCKIITNELSEGLLVPADRVSLKNNLTCAGLFSEFGRGISFV